MITLNSHNGADQLLAEYVAATAKAFPGKLIAVMMGIAYGGDVEMCARAWKNRGVVYGYDTFDLGHPGHLSQDPNSFEVTCMNYYYGLYGREGLSLDYQRSELARQGLSNAILVPGEVNPQSCVYVPYINLAWLDMDLTCSMRTGFHAVKDKVVPGGFLALHDVVPQGHIPGNYELFYNELFDPKQWAEVCRRPESFFLVWQKLNTGNANVNAPAPSTTPSREATAANADDVSSSTSSRCRCTSGPKNG